MRDFIKKVSILFIILFLSVPLALMGQLLGSAAANDVPVKLKKQRRLLGQFQDSLLTLLSCRMRVDRLVKQFQMLRML